jgi:hypothetical protein
MTGACCSGVNPPVLPCPKGSAQNARRGRDMLLGQLAPGSVDPDLTFSLSQENLAILR